VSAELAAAAESGAECHARRRRRVDGGDAGPGDHVNLNLTRDPVAPVAPGINVEPRAFQCHAAAGCASVPYRDY
jgi:hypothetical protein